MSRLGQLPTSIDLETWKKIIMTSNPGKVLIESINEPDPKYEEAVEIELSETEWNKSDIKTKVQYNITEDQIRYRVIDGHSRQVIYDKRPTFKYEIRDKKISCEMTSGTIKIYYKGKEVSRFYSNFITEYEFIEKCNEIINREYSDWLKLND